MAKHAYPERKKKKVKTKLKIKKGRGAIYRLKNKSRDALRKLGEG